MRMFEFFRQRAVALTLVLFWHVFPNKLFAVSNSERIIPGEVLVKFKSTHGERVTQALPSLAGAKVKRFLPRLGWHRIKLPAGMAVMDALEHFSNLPEVARVEPSYRVELYAAPNDPAYPRLWGMEKIGVPQAWDTTTGSTNIVVGIVDTGIYYPHPDLAANVWTNPAEIPGNGMDDDNNGYVDDVHGLNVTDGNGDPLDDDGHGTHVAGTIGAVGNNGVGVTGVNWSVQLMSLRIFSADHFSGTADVVEAYDYALMMKDSGINLRVINNSWGGTHPSFALKEAICTASDAGILSVCSAGNDHQNNDEAPHFPAGYDCDGIIVVAASTTADELADFTDYGPRTVHLAAPGVGTFSTFKGGPFYVTYSGTSMASPHVSGAAALLLSRKPDLTLAQLKFLLLDSVDQLPAWSGKVISGGRLNVARAMQKLVSNSPINAAASNNLPAGALTNYTRFTNLSRNSLGRLGNDYSINPVISADGRFVAFASDATNLIPSDKNGWRDVFLLDRQLGSITRISESVQGRAGNDDSDEPAINADGRFVVFQSYASNLVPGDTNDSSDIFLYDRLEKTISLVSRSDNGELADSDSEHPVISDDGNFIAYASDATNLVPADTNFTRDIFVQDRLRQQSIRRANLADDGSESLDDSDYPVISGDGRFVAFHSVADDLIPGDRNGQPDVFVADMVSNRVERISVDSRGREAKGVSLFPAISGDGRFVVFQSNAANLVAGDGNGVTDVFLHDRETKATTRISTANDGTEAEASCLFPAISGDGRYIVFRSAASALTPGQADAFRDIFLYDRLLTKLSRVTITSSGLSPSDDSFFPKVSDGGRFIVFDSFAYNLVPGDGNASINVLLADRGESLPDLMIRNAGETIFAGVGAYGTNVVQRKAQTVASGATARYELRLENSGRSPETFVIRGDGGRAGWNVRYFDAATNGNLITTAITGAGWTTPALSVGESAWLRIEVTAIASTASIPDVYQVTVQACSTNEVSETDGIRAVTARPFSPPGLSMISRNTDGAPGNDLSRSAALSADGRFVAFGSDVSTFFADDLNDDRDVFVFDRGTSGIELISAAADGTPGNARSELPSISRDGRFVAFQSYATNLVRADTNNRHDVFVKDRDSGAIKRVSVTTAGKEANGGSESARISGNGQFVVFQSFADNLVAGDTNRAWDVFLHERATGKLRCLSLSTNGVPGNGDSTLPNVTPDGAFVVFDSYATDLVSGDQNNEADVFIFDTTRGVLELISRTPAGRAGNASSSGATISDDGRFVLFSSSATDLLADEDKSRSGIFLLDRTTGLMNTIDPTPVGGPGDAAFSGPVLSPDARWVALNSAVPGLVAGNTNHVGNVYLFDRQDASLICLSLTRDGFPGNDHSYGAAFSADGRFVGFRSYAQNLLAELAAATSQVFVFDRANFQPDLAIRRAGTNDSYHGNNAFSPAPQIIQEIASPGATNIFLIVVQNTRGFHDQFVLTGSSGDGITNAINYFDAAAGVDITAAMTGAGFNTGDVAPGERREIRMVVRSLQVAEADRDVSVTVASISDPTKLDVVTGRLLADADGDGLPDFWERIYFGSLTVANVATDQDGDGATDLAEFLAGTNPKDASSVLRISQAERTGDQTQLRWTSEPDRVYIVERSTNLTNGFTPIATRLSATPPENAFIDTASPSATEVFYRIRVERP